MQQHLNKIILLELKNNLKILLQKFKNTKNLQQKFEKILKTLIKIFVKFIFKF